VSHVPQLVFSSIKLYCQSTLRLAFVLPVVNKPCKTFLNTTHHEVHHPGELLKLEEGEMWLDIVLGAEFDALSHVVGCCRPVSTTINHTLTSLHTAVVGSPDLEFAHSHVQLFTVSSARDLRCFVT